jgi:uncharacterized protein (DUF433 family)
MENLQQRITTNPKQCGGRPCIRGMRVRVIDVLDLLASGLSHAQILEELPDLELEDIQAVLTYKSKGELALQRFLWDANNLMDKADLRLEIIKYHEAGEEYSISFNGNRLEYSKGAVKAYSIYSGDENILDYESLLEKLN